MSEVCKAYYEDLERAYNQKCQDVERLRYALTLIRQEVKKPAIVGSKEWILKLIKETMKETSDLEFRRELYKIAINQRDDANERERQAIRERDNALSDWKQADVDTLRALHERNEARRELERFSERLDEALKELAIELVRNKELSDRLKSGLDTVVTINSDERTQSP